jgi:hypothetical protein
MLGKIIPWSEIFNRETNVPLVVVQFEPFYQAPHKYPTVKEIKYSALILCSVDICSGVYDF